MSKEIIRIATLDDAEEFLGLMQAAFKPLGELGIEWPSVHATLEDVEKNISRSTAYVLERDGELLSTITIKFPWDEESSVSGYPFVWWFATKPECKGQGLGNKLLTYVEEKVLRDDLKVPAVTLGTSLKFHPWLRGIYERRGYELYVTRERDYGDVDGLMRKVLIPERFSEEILGMPEFEDAEQGEEVNK